jgi:hypothetical protein
MHTKFYSGNPKQDVSGKHVSIYIYEGAVRTTTYKRVKISQNYGGKSIPFEWKDYAQVLKRIPNARKFLTSKCN